MNISVRTAKFVRVVKCPHKAEVGALRFGKSHVFALKYSSPELLGKKSWEENIFSQLSQCHPIVNQECGFLVFIAVPKQQCSRLVCKTAIALVLSRKKKYKFVNDVRPQLVSDARRKIVTSTRPAALR